MLSNRLCRRDASDREGLWSGEADAPLSPTFTPWLALRLSPGENPDLEPWTFQQGLEGGPLGGLFIRCIPEAVEGGWEMESCTRLRGAFEGSDSDDVRAIREREWAQIQAPPRGLLARLYLESGSRTG